MVTVTAIPAFRDNYLWLIEANGHCYVIDPGDGSVVRTWLQKEHKHLSAILVTHHHSDHIGGIDQLLHDYPVPVYGPNSPYIPQITQPLKDGDHLTLPGLLLKVIAIPGHTIDHIAYFAEPSKQDPLLFCGDTLFAGGCGRIFDGTAALLYKSLAQLSQLPSNTQVFCAHEYTLNNLKFAQVIEPSNTDLIQRTTVEQQKRSLNQPTVPTTIATERSTNPFLRCQLENVRKTVEDHYRTATSSALEVFTLLRQWKDEFKH
jgi:hydroxyacylglutathione hydrolase